MPFEIYKYVDEKMKLKKAECKLKYNDKYGGNILAKYEEMLNNQIELYLSAKDKLITAFKKGMKTYNDDIDAYHVQKYLYTYDTDYDNKPKEYWLTEHAIANFEHMLTIKGYKYESEIMDNQTNKYCGSYTYVCDITV